MEQINLDTLSDRLCAAGCGTDISHKRADAKCCSRKCYHRHLRGVSVPPLRLCVVCSADISHKQASAIYCSDVCNSARWRGRNPEKHRVAVARWRKANPEKCAALGRQWRKLNPEKVAEYNRAYAAENPAKVAEGKKRWAENNLSKVAAKQRRWRALNPERRKAHARACSGKRRALKRCAVALQPVTADLLSQRLSLFNGCCSYCGNAGSMTVDHFIPLASGGGHSPSNLVPACGRCNSSKQDADPEQWFRAQPFFTEKRWQQILKAVGKTKQHHGQLALL